jgi:hypothetical protein
MQTISVNLDGWPFLCFWVVGILHVIVRKFAASRSRRSNLYSLCMCPRRCTGHRHRLLFLSHCRDGQIHGFGRSRAGDGRLGGYTSVRVNLGMPCRGFACDGRSISLSDGMLRCSGTGQSSIACLELGGQLRGSYCAYGQGGLINRGETRRDSMAKASQDDHEAEQENGLWKHFDGVQDTEMDFEHRRKGESRILLVLYPVV